ncbi:MAG: hypothetical protein PHF86_03260 [Candidatus Nanoarchaeia archaeon]|jgi:hypothetical protein|nr:hypothetical protein [Candidatus Nanoarchaeia archaeon]
MNERQKIKLIEQHIDLPVRKVLYIISHVVLVEGLWGCLESYGLERTEENHELVVELVQTKIEGPDMEREWTEEEYESFVKWKPINKEV